MANSVIITIKSEDTITDLERILQLDASKDKEGALAIKNYMNMLASGMKRGIIDVQVGADAPVAASGTWTLASVVDTDACSLAGVTLTFASSPATESDIEVDIGSAKAFASATDININTGTITETTHGYLTGDVVQLTTSSALPGGFALSTDYYIYKIDADTYKICSSLANANAGIPIYPTSVGTGNQTVTPQADKTMAIRLYNAVNAHSVLSTIVEASVSGAVVTVTARQKGVLGNYIAFSDADSTITSSGSGYLANGTGGAKDSAIQYNLGIS